MGWKRVEDRRAYDRAYMRERRAWLRAHGLCTECKQEDARTMAGFAICFGCFEKKHGHPPVVDDGMRQKDRRMSEPKHGVPKSEYYASGLCAKCGSAAYLPGHRLCQHCYDATLRAAWLGRKAQGMRPISPPRADTLRAREAYRYCVEHRQEYEERWMAEYGGEYEDRASAKAAEYKKQETGGKIRRGVHAG